MSGERPISRRAIFSGQFLRDAAARSAVPKPKPAVPPRPHAGPPLRPPGAVDEPTFLERCTRCGDCIDVCPPDAIVLAGPEWGPAAGTPIIEPMRSPCVVCDGLPCIASCEPGVLLATLPVKMGTASIIEHDCVAFEGMACTVCFEHCPVPEVISISGGRPAIDAAGCTGCGVCQHVCPAPRNAVDVRPAPRGVE